MKIEIEKELVDSIYEIVSDAGRSSLELLCLAFQGAREAGPVEIQESCKVMAEDKEASQNLIAAAHLGCVLALRIYDQSQRESQKTE